MPSRTAYLQPALVVLAGSSIETVRLALHSHPPDPARLIGRGVMFHSCLLAYGLFADRMHTDIGRNITHCLDDFCSPEFSNSRQVEKGAGLPFFRGGVVELGFGTVGPIQEALIYRRLLKETRPEKPFGKELLEYMRSGIVRQNVIGLMMHGENLCQLENRVVLSRRRDFRGVPVPLIEYGGHHERVAQDFYGTWLHRILVESGAVAAAVAREIRTSDAELGGTHSTDFHTLGGMRASVDPSKGVVDAWSRMHNLGNVLVADGSVFPSSGAHNFTLTIMAVALRAVRNAVYVCAGVRSIARAAPIFACVQWSRRRRG